MTVCGEGQSFDCPRPHCRGLVVSTDGEHRCILCGRPGHTGSDLSELYRVRLMHLQREAELSSQVGNLPTLVRKSMDARRTAAQSKLARISAALAGPTRGGFHKSRS